MNDFKILFKKDMLEIFRTKKWLIYLITFLAIVVISVVTARLLPELLNLLLVGTEAEGMYEYQYSVGDSYVQFVSNMGQIGWLLIAVMFSTSLVREKTHGTYQMLKSNGVSEFKIVLSHFLTKLVLITLAYLASLILFIPMNLIIFKEYAGLRGFVSLSYLYLSLVFALSLALFVSSLVNKNKAGYAIVIIIYFVLTILSVFPYIDIYNPLYGLTLANNIIIKTDYEISDYLINLFITIALNVGLIIASIYLFKNKVDNRKAIWEKKF